MENKNLHNYVFYTDGAYSSSRDQGGIGLIALKNDIPILKYSKMFKHTTNNRMELGAIIMALKTIKNKVNSIIIYTDSMYCVGCIKLGWKRKKNQPLWNVFDTEYNRVQRLCSNIEFIHIKGHSNNKYNEIVDKLAVSASQRI